MSSPMTLRNFGGVYQLVIESAEDLGKIGGIDAAKWSATSAPLKDLHVDPALLGFLDADLNGRIRVAGVLAARDWLFARLSDRSGVTAKSDELTLSSIDLKQVDGEKLLHGAEHVLRELDLAGRPSLKLDDVRAFRAGYAKTLRNGDGVVPPELVPDLDVAAFVRAVMSTVGSAPDASGFVGVGDAQLTRYLEGARAYLTWKASGQTLAGVLPLGDATGGAWAQVQALDAKIDEQFLRCEFMQQENLSSAALKLTDDEIHALRAKDAKGIEAYLEASPLAEPDASCKLPIGGKVNPAFQDKWEALSQGVLSRLLPGETMLDRAGWRTIKAALQPYAEWSAQKPPEPFEAIGDAELEAQLNGPLPEKLRGLITHDAAAAAEVSQIATLEKLILFQRWLIELANNFVNFSSLYNPEKTAMIEMGAFVVDGRRLEFCIKVDTAERAGHKKVAADSLAFLVYAQITESDGKPAAFEICAPVTAGERGRLRVGKRGIFVDVAGREWDAAIVEIVENPISILEAMLAPFRRLQKFIAERIEKMAAAQASAHEAAMQSSTAASVTTAGNVATGAAPLPAAPAAAPAAAAPGSNLQNLLIGGSIALAALGSTAAFVVSAVSNTSPLKLVGGVLGVIAVIAAINGFLGWLKLRRRDMSMLLEASGWAVNAQMLVTRRVGITFTRKPGFPKGTKIARFDVLSTQDEAVEQDRTRRNWRILAIFIAALVAGAIAGRCWYVHVQRQEEAAAHAAAVVKADAEAKAAEAKAAEAKAVSDAQATEAKAAATKADEAKAAEAKAADAKAADAKAASEKK